MILIPSKHKPSLPNESFNLLPEKLDSSGVLPILAAGGRSVGVVVVVPSFNIQQCCFESVLQFSNRKCHLQHVCNEIWFNLEVSVASGAGPAVF